MLFRFLAAALALGFVLSAPALAGDDAKKKKKAGPDLEKVFKQLDADSDGKLTPDEFKNLTSAVPQPKKKKAPAIEFDEAFKKLDADKDGKLTPDEFKKAADVLPKPKKKKKADK